MPDPQLRLDAPVGGGENWPGYAYVVDTVRSLLPMMEQMGLVSAKDVDVETLADRLRAEALGLREVQMLPIVMEAWARKL